MKYRPEIDGLRALAVIPVILFHAGFDAFGGGFVGVDIFFVISGYLITTIIADDIRSGRFSVAKFYERRARRILPALLLVCLACIPFAWHWMTPSEYRSFSQSLVAVATFSSNILFWRETDYFAPAVELKPLLHTWSLAVEEQFYVVFPLLLFAALRFSTRVALAVIGVIAAGSLALSIYAASNMPSAGFYLIPFRAWELGVGAMLALAPGSGDRTRPAIATLASLSGVGLIVYSIVRFDFNTPFPGYHALTPVLGTALLIRFSGADGVVGQLLRLAPVVKIGLFSYSLYLWHQPILAFLRMRTLDDPQSVQIYLAIALTFVLAGLTWKLVETPFRRRDKVSTRTVVTSGVVASMLVATVGLLGHFTNGFPDASAERENAQSLEHRLRDNYGLGRACKEEFTLSEDCRTDDAPEILVWGDSFAMHLVDGLLASKPDVRMIQMTKSGCGPVLGLAPLDPAYPLNSTEYCLEFNRKVLDWISANETVRYAILSSLFTRFYDSDGRFYTEQGFIDADEEFAVERFVATLDTLKSHGIIPVLVSPPPRYGPNIGRCLVRSQVLGLADDACDFSRGDFEAAQARTIRFLRAVAKYHRVIWLDEVMCTADRCRAAFGETLLYTDYGHLSHEGSAELGRRIGLYDEVVGNPPH